MLGSERRHKMWPIFLLLPFLISGCAVVAVADLAVSVTATAVKAGAVAVGTAVDVTAAGVKVVIGTDAKK